MLGGAIAAAKILGLGFKGDRPTAASLAGFLFVLRGFRLSFSLSLRATIACRVLLRAGFCSSRIGSMSRLALRSRRDARAGAFSGCGVGVLRLLPARTPRESAIVASGGARRCAMYCALRRLSKDE